MSQELRPKTPPMPSDVPVPPEERTGGIAAVDPLLVPDLATLYERRIERLATLAKQAGEDGGAYLNFLKEVVTHQRTLLREHPLSPVDMAHMGAWLNSPQMPDAATLQQAAFWQGMFRSFISHLAPQLPAQQAAALEELGNNPAALAKQAHLFLSGDFLQADGAAAVPLWATLSLCWAQGAAMLLPDEESRKARAIPEATNCPCCGAIALGSLVMTGAREGLRYQQCSLCETRWHRVRSLCTVCGESGKLDYWSLDDQKAPIEMETCGDCQSANKILRFDRNPQQELVADDLGSFALDALLEEKGFTRATINPFALPV